MSSKASFFSRLQASATSSPLRTLLVSATVLSTATAVYLLVRRLRLQRIESRSTAPPSARPTSLHSTGNAKKRHAASSSSSNSLHSSSNGKEEGEKKDAEGELDADSIFIYFGSQTGTAESYSEELASAILEEVEGVKRVPVIDLEDFDAEKFLKQKFKILVVATCGEGEPTDNARDFFAWLKDYAHSCEKSATAEALSSSPRMRGFAAVFGFGNREYEHYNRMGKRTHKLLHKIHKAQRAAFSSQEGDSPSIGSSQVKDANTTTPSVFQLLCPLGLGDGAGDPDADFAQWQREQLLPRLQQVFSGGQGEASPKTDEVSSYPSLVASEGSLVSSPPMSPLHSQALPNGQSIASGLVNKEGDETKLEERRIDGQGEVKAFTSFERGGTSESLNGPTADQFLLGTSRSGSGASAIFEENVAIERAKKKVGMWVRRHTEETFRLAVGSSIAVLLAEHQRVEARILVPMTTSRGNSLLVSSSSSNSVPHDKRTKERIDTEGLNSNGDGRSSTLKKTFWDYCRLRQTPQGVSAKFFFNMQEAPVRRVEELRQKPNVRASWPSSSSTDASSSSPASSTESQGREDDKATAKEESTVEVELDLTELPSIQYRAADTMYCLHRNSHEEISWWHEFLGFKDQGISLSDYLHWLPGPDALSSSSSSSSYAVPFPTPCTVEEALGYYCNLTGQLPKFALSCLSLWITDPDERRQWLFLVSEHHRACSIFESCIKVPQLSLRDLLPVLAPSFKRPEIPIFHLEQESEKTSTLQRMENDGDEESDDNIMNKRELGLVLSLLAFVHFPRAYTIASSPLQISKEMGIRTVCLCVGLVAEHRDSLEASIHRLQENGLKCFWSPIASQQPRTMLRQDQRLFLGACSSYLTRQLKKGDYLQILVKPSSFRLPSNVRTPVIMVAAGTGIAPFIAFLRELESRGGWGSSVVLFFGCRRENEDFLYRDQLLELAGEKRTSEHGKRKDGKSNAKNGAPVLTHLFCAFSRQPGQRRVYVQDKLREEKDLVWKLLREEQGNLYMCGRTAMAAGVTEELGRIAREKLGGEEQGSAFIHDLKHMVYPGCSLSSPPPS
ncbi:flavodoxin domain-containing protein [Cystoisospora suis]|uniref:Flavodoxin domain-containing protein n=1 Tax=Cystoisospora suis TaxID=483139 RepID=A0A2C6L6I3_9APIC|nr:flavodoxin domain-containing protein [Cystoisospora suis]